MKATFLPSGKIDRRLLPPFFALTVLLLVGLGGLVLACGSEETTTTVSSATATTHAVTTTTAAAITSSQAATTTTSKAVTTTTVLVPMSAAEIGQWKTDAMAFRDRFDGAYPDADAQLAQLADDATFYCPSSGMFLVKGKQSIVTMLRAVNQWKVNSGAKDQWKTVYLSGDGAAYATTTENVWVPWEAPEPADHPPSVDLLVFRFKDGQVTSWEHWFSASTLEMGSNGCFAPGKGGSERLQEIVDRYLSAWASGDKAQIAALYHPDAVFSDTMRGLQAQGAAAISELSDRRFGSAGKITCEVMDLYGLTNGPTPPTDELPENGVIIGVGIHYRCNLVVDGKPSTVESLTAFELGTRQGKSFAPDPDGLITREEVFYDADSLLASGLVR